MDDEKWASGKKEHIALSDSAADEYDELYASSNFATGSYMDYELKVIDRAIDQVRPRRRRLALDLGCGTGRDAFHFNKHFDQVYGYDFSKKMIACANQKKLKRPAGNVSFHERDLEVDLLTVVETESAAFVNSGFGMGSFISQPRKFLKEIRRVLEPEGVFVVSFYNKNSLVVQLGNLEWSPSLSARLDSTGSLRVAFKGTEYEIPVQAYSVTEARNSLEHYFEVLEVSTFPTLSSLLPNTLFTSEQARKLCSVVDHELQFNEEISGGPYIAAVCRKHGQSPKEAEVRGYEYVLRLLAQHHISLDAIHSHGPVLDLDDVAGMLKVGKEQLVKTILVSVAGTPEKHGPAPKPRYYAVALQGDRRTDFARLAHELGVKRDAISMVKIGELERKTGFSAGEIPPFGYPRDINVILDERVLQQSNVYCGVGKQTESLRISVDNLRKLASPYVCAISKE